MSGYSAMHIPVSQSDQFNAFDINLVRQSSPSSVSSNSSSHSFGSPSDNQWESQEVGENHNKRSSKRGVSTFISKLFSMVSDKHNQHLISWNPNGSSFLVRNATRFSQEILPEHFKHSNFSSFVRQLNMYGFHKINKSPRGHRENNENEIWEFSHPKFQRGRPKILEHIKRKAMDSELLRRETGDIHASFAMVQLSQAELLQQFRALQENYANLLQGFEEMKKVQLQQQMIIKRLTETQNISNSPFFDSSEPSNSSQPTVFITSPSGSPLQSWDQQQILMPPIYQSNHNMNSNHHTSEFNFSLNTQNTFPPSPVPSVLLSSTSSCDEPQQKNTFNTKPMSIQQGLILTI